MNDLQQICGLFTVWASETHKGQDMLALSQVHGRCGVKAIQRVQIDGCCCLWRFRVCTDVHEPQQEGCAYCNRRHKKAYVFLVLVRFNVIYFPQDDGCGDHSEVLPHSLQWRHAHLIAETAAVAGIALLHDHDEQINNEYPKYGNNRLVSERPEKNVANQEQAEQHFQPYHHPRQDTSEQYAAYSQVEKSPLKTVERIIVLVYGDWERGVIRGYTPSNENAQLAIGRIKEHPCKDQ